MVKSFFINESGFVAPWTTLSYSWIVGILAGAATLFGAVSPALAERICSDDCRGVKFTLDCGWDFIGDCEIECRDNGSYCECAGSCS